MDIKEKAIGILGVDEYYRTLRALESDVKFFRLFMEREAKSEFRFDVRIAHSGSYYALDKIWGKRHMYYIDSLEDAFAEYVVMKKFFAELERASSSDKLVVDGFTDEELKELVDYFERYDELSLDDFVGDFIGCSMMCTAVLRILEDLRKYEE